jgi:hypothetical protein
MKAKVIPKKKPLSIVAFRKQAIKLTSNQVPYTYQNTGASRQLPFAYFHNLNPAPEIKPRRKAGKKSGGKRRKKVCIPDLF